MANTTEVVKVLLQAETQELDLLKKKADNALNTLAKFPKVLNNNTFKTTFRKISSDIEMTTRKVQQLNIQSSKTGQWWEKSKNGVMGFNGALLSTLFFGMEMQRIFGGALKSVFESYKKIIPESNSFNIATTKLAANWEFFKFQLADALAQSPIFQVFIGFAIKLLKWFQGLSETTKTWLTALLAIGAVTGAFLMFTGVIGLGIAGLADMGVTMGTVLTAAGLLAAAIGFTIVVAGIADLIDLAEQTVTGKESVEALETAFSNLGTTILNDIISTFTGLETSMWDASTTGAYFGQVMLNVFSYIGTALSGLVLLWKNGWTFMELVVGSAILAITGMAQGLLKVLQKIAEASDAVFGTDLADSVTSAYNTLKDFNSELIKTINPMNDINSSWSDFQSSVGDFGAAIKSPSQVASEYGQIRDVKSGEYNVNNINVMMIQDAVAQGLVSQDDYNKLVDAMTTLGVTGN